jgi:hypothetical protein
MRERNSPHWRRPSIAARRPSNGRWPELLRTRRPAEGAFDELGPAFAKIRLVIIVRMPIASMPVVMIVWMVIIAMIIITRVIVIMPIIISVIIMPTIIRTIIIPVIITTVMVIGFFHGLCGDRGLQSPDAGSGLQKT